MKSLFITGTGTSVGKTFVCAAIAISMVRREQRLAYYKPAMSGVSTISHSDAGFVHQAANLAQGTDTLVSYLYSLPYTIHLAARTEQNFLSLLRVENDFQRLMRSFDYVLCEGSGGVVCPVVYEEHSRIFYTDIMQVLGSPIILVADSGLGTISHSVTALEYLRAFDLPLAGVILNRYDSDNPLHADNLLMIEELGQVPVVGVLAEGSLELEVRGRELEDYFA